MSGIKVITCFYREELLVPHFLNHYSYADTILVLGGNSPDNTRALFEADPRVIWQDLDMPEGMDDIRKLVALNEALNTPDKHDWSIVVDSDELIWPHAPGGPEDLSRGWVEDFLSSVPEINNVVMANMWQVYRHATDADLDTTRPPVLQRRHGIPDRDSGGREGYRKPAVIRTGTRLQLGAGNHRIDAGDARIEPYLTFDGAHWALADPSFAVKRRTRDRRDRMSVRNRAGQLGSHLWNITSKGLLDEIAAHANDPQLF